MKKKLFIGLFLSVAILSVGLFGNYLYALSDGNAEELCKEYYSGECRSYVETCYFFSFEGDHELRCFFRDSRSSQF